jgi:DeoR family transcriptional regulator, aga operon transcriptional repressor
LFLPLPKIEIHIHKYMTAISSMLSSKERKQRILQILTKQRAVQVSELALLFGVSEVTIRRDLNCLVEQSQIERVYGGAILSQRELAQVPIQQREVMNLAEKKRIGRAAAQFVHDGDTIIIAGGTTTAEMARNLGNRHNLIVITPALNIAYILADHPEITVIVTGGVLVGPEVTLAGHFGEQALRELHADKLFLGAGAFDPVVGITSEHPSEIGVNRAMITAARECFLLIDHTKFGSVLTCLVATTDQLSYVLTDEDVSPNAIEQLQEMDVQVVCA